MCSIVHVVLSCYSRVRANGHFRGCGDAHCCILLSPSQVRLGPGEHAQVEFAVNLHDLTLTAAHGLYYPSYPTHDCGVLSTFLTVAPPSLPRTQTHTRARASGKEQERWRWGAVLVGAAVGMSGWRISMLLARDLHARLL